MSPQSQMGEVSLVWPPASCTRKPRGQGVSMSHVQVDPELCSKCLESHPRKDSPVPGMLLSQWCHPQHIPQAPLPAAAGGCAELERSCNYRRGLDAVGVLLLKSSLIEREKLP